MRRIYSGPESIWRDLISIRDEDASRSDEVKMIRSLSKKVILKVDGGEGDGKF